MARTVRDSGIVVLEAINVDLTAASADAPVEMFTPGDGAQLLDWTLTISVAGVGAGTHTCTLEQGVGAGGVAVSAPIAFIATDAADTKYTADGVYLATTTQGSRLQIQNVESGTNITTGAIVDVIARWQL